MSVITLPFNYIYFIITNKCNIYNVYEHKFIKIGNCGKTLLHGHGGAAVRLQEQEDITYIIIITKSRVCVYGPFILQKQWWGILM